MVDGMGGDPSTEDHAPQAHDNPDWNVRPLHPLMTMRISRHSGRTFGP